ncbi:putative ABC transporter permease [[Clostridium] hylemonae]|uniref:putative ABC transporter permease n=1 Tax=[Clostridium] hylemonae TaxID=89153 RepID=UPI0024330C85|nr:hypothetical protein [[Clostridium] hylemonae]
MFFAFSGIGWIWEVILHIIEDGMIINRGVMTGPWLPIYGMGSLNSSCPEKIQSPAYAAVRNYHVLMWSDRICDKYRAGIFIWPDGGITAICFSA